MSLGELGDFGVVAVALAAVGLPLQLALGLAVAMGRRVPVSAALFVPVSVLVFGLAGVVSGYQGVAKGFIDPADPAWAPWYALYDRGTAAAPGLVAARLAIALLVPASLGAAVAGLRHERKGTIGPLVAGAGGMLAGLALLGVGFGLDRLQSAALSGLTIPLLAVGVAGSLCALRPRDLAIAGMAVGSLVVGCIAIFVEAAALSDLVVPELLPDLNAGWSAPRQLAAYAIVSRQWLTFAAILPWIAVAAALPGLGFLRSRRTTATAGLDIAASGALILAVVVALGWVAMHRATVGRMAGAHAAWVLSEAPMFDVPRIDVLPPRVLVVSPSIRRWVELRDGGGVGRLDAVGDLDEVGKALRRGDGLVLSTTLTAEDVYVLLVDSPAGSISIVGCEPVSAAHYAILSVEPILAVGRCGSFPIKLLVSGLLPDPREVILLKDRFVQDVMDVIPLTELTNVTGRDIILRMQADAAVPDLVAALTILKSAASVYLGWGVTLEGNDIPVGVQPGLRVVSEMPSPLPGELDPVAAPPAGEAATPALASP